MLDEWLDATARNPDGAAVRFSSCFPFHGETRFVVPPQERVAAGRFAEGPLEGREVRSACRWSRRC